METKKNKKKVLHVTVRMGFGGIETWICDILTNYDKERFQMDLCLIGKRGEPGELIDVVINAKSNVFIIPLKNPYKFWKEFERLANYYDLIIIHAGIYLSPFMLFRSNDNYKQSRMIMIHSTRYYLPFKFLGLEQNNYVLNVTKKIFNIINVIYSTRILSCSQAARNYNFSSLGKKKSEIVSYGINIDKFTPPIKESDFRNKYDIPRDALVIGNIGRLTYLKNHQMFINVANSLVHKDKKYFFILVGDGELRKEIVDQIHKLGLDKYFLLTGFTNDVCKYLSLMDLVFFPSRHEGFPISLLETEAHGIPVVTGKQPELKEVICPDNHDWCLANTNDVYDCISKIELILSNKDIYSKIQISGINWVRQNYSINRSLSSLEDIIQKY